MATAALKSRRRPAVSAPVPADDPYCVVMPAGATTLAGFRAWSASDGFPKHGRITFLGGEVIIDMSPERIDSHGQVKIEMTIALGTLVKARALGRLFPDRSRLVNAAAELSGEPDLMFASGQTLKAGTLRRVPTKDRKDAIEMEGTPDMVLEIVSPGSEQKDTELLRAGYFRAGIPEYWLVNATGDAIDFQILRRGPREYRSKRTKTGWQLSAVFGTRFRLTRHKDELDEWIYRLEMK